MQNIEHKKLKIFKKNYQLVNLAKLRENFQKIKSGADS